MSGTVVVLGSGVMAGQIGAHLLGRGMDVTWVSARPERREYLATMVQRTVRRLARTGAPGRAQVCSPDEAPAAAGQVRCLIEATREALDAKRAAIAAVKDLLQGGALLVSASSSILPARIHDACAGLHFFAPLALSGFAELIVERGRPAELRDRARAFAADIGIENVEQDERSAFAVNRLLLPVQNEALLALAAGMPAGQVDEATAVFGGGSGSGQLALMDRVGLDTIGAAVAAYRSRMEPLEAMLFAPLDNGLAALRALGKRGAVNHDGFLEGAPLPGRAVPVSAAELTEFALRCRGLVVNRALAFERDGVMDRRTADTVWRSVFFAQRTLSQWLEGDGLRPCAQALARAYQATRRQYFAPVGRLAELAGPDHA